MPSLLAVRRHNEAHGNSDAELFEIANVYLPHPGQPLPDEPTRLALVCGRDYLGLKGVIEALLERLAQLPARSCGSEVRPQTQVPLFAPGRCAELVLGGTHLGYLGEVAGTLRDALELREPCAAAELEFGVLQVQAVLVPTYRPLPPFPAVLRDLSLVVPQSLAQVDPGTPAITARSRTIARGDRLPRYVPWGHRPPRQAEPSLRPAIPPFRADAHR